jgi:hypothetical protein
MKTSTITAAIGFTLVAAVLTGCSATPHSATPSGDSPLGSSLVPFLPATESPFETAPPVVLDAVEQAQIDSGLTPEVYAEVTAKVASIVSSIDEKDPFLAAVEALEAEYGKPVALVAYVPCYGSDQSEWAISGALFGTAPPGCGYGYAESREAALDKVEERAKRQGWGANDYILVFNDSVN